MSDNANQGRYSRRQWTALAGTFAAAVPLSAQEAAPANRDMLQERRDGMAGTAAALERVPLTPSDEPIFGMVVE